jgi:hypothetical protein
MVSRAATLHLQQDARRVPVPSPESRHTLPAIAAAIRIQTQSRQELFLNHSAKAGMRNLMTTAVRALPLRYRTHPIHGIDSIGRLTRLFVPFAIRGLGSNGLPLDIAQAKGVA